MAAKVCTLCLSLCVCVTLCLSVCLSLSLSLCLPACLSPSLSRARCVPRSFSLSLSPRAAGACDGDVHHLPRMERRPDPSRRVPERRDRQDPRRRDVGGEGQAGGARPDRYGGGLGAEEQQARHVLAGSKQLRLEHRERRVEAYAGAAAPHKGSDVRPLVTERGQVRGGQRRKVGVHLPVHGGVRRGWRLDLQVHPQVPDFREVDQVYGSLRRLAPEQLLPFDRLRGFQVPRLQRLP